MAPIDLFWRPTFVADMFMFLGPIGIAFFFGIMVGLRWKPKWATLPNCKFEPTMVNNQCNWSNHNLHNSPLEVRPDANFGSGKMDIKNVEEPLILVSRNNPNCSSLVVEKEENYVPNDEDLKHLWHLVERKDGGPPWKHMMDRSTNGMCYQAWQRDPECGPTQYRTKTVYKNATPELMRDFLWDDEFRLKWDDMISHASTVHEFPNTGASVVHWIRKFPLFCSDREYTISRRIWELDGSYYCVTKGVPYPSVPRKQKPLRVDLYYSSWFIQSVESKIGTDDQPLCEVTFFHHEDMGIPKEIARFGVRQGMWGAAKNVEHGFRSYQKERAISKTISLHVVMAQMSTKIDENHLASLQSSDNDHHLDMADQTKVVQVVDRQDKHKMVRKFLVIGGAILVASSIDRGLLTKVVVSEIARRFAFIGRQAGPQRQCFFSFLYPDIYIKEGLGSRKNIKEKKLKNIKGVFDLDDMY